MVYHGGGVQGWRTPSWYTYAFHSLLIEVYLSHPTLLSSRYSPTSSNKDINTALVALKRKRSDCPASYEDWREALACRVTVPGTQKSKTALLGEQSEKQSVKY